MQFEALVKEKIAELSAGPKKVAQYILGHLEETSYLTLTKISREANVSETTVIRFAYSIGFESFSAMQGALQQEILGNNSVKAEGNAHESAYYDHVLNREISILEKTKKGLSRDKVDEAVERLYRADMVFSVGSRTGFPAALWFGIALGRFRDGVFPVNPVGEDFFSNVMKVTEHSVVVAISMARYSKATYRFIQQAKARGASIILVTDSQISPPALLADLVFLTESNRDETGINTISSISALLNIMAVGLRRRDPRQAMERLKVLETLYLEQNDVIFE